MNEVTVGSTRAGGYVRISVAGYQHPSQTDFWDGNWLISLITVEVGGFSAKLGASLRLDEFESFLAELSRLDETVSGKATFTTMESQLSLELEADRLGHISVMGRVTDPIGGSNHLVFRIPDFDQSYLPILLGEIRELLSALPIRGR